MVTENTLLGIKSFQPRLFGVKHGDPKVASSFAPSRQIFGRFQEIKKLTHPHLSPYTKIVLGRKERVFLVFEYHSRNLDSLIDENQELSPAKRKRIAYQLCTALVHLHQHNYVHGCISPSSIMFDEQDNVYLTDYCLNHTTMGYKLAEFPFGHPAFLPPELLASSPEKRSTFLPQNDSYALGVILYTLGSLGSPSAGTLYSPLRTAAESFEVTRKLCGHNRTGAPSAASPTTAGPGASNQPWSTATEGGLPLPHTLPASSTHPSHPHTPKRFWGEVLLDAEKSIESFLELLPPATRADASFLEFLRDCLAPSVLERASPETLLKHRYFEEMAETDGAEERASSPPEHVLLPQNEDRFLAQLGWEEVMFFLSISGFHPEKTQNGTASPSAPGSGLDSVPTVLRIPLHVRGASGVALTAPGDVEVYADTTTVLPLAPLVHRLRAAHHLLSTAPHTHWQQFEAQPLSVRENDIDYQLHRLSVLRPLLATYPLSHTTLLKTIKCDVPSPLRPAVWRILTATPPDYAHTYSLIDKLTPHPIDRQIEVDIPRCHQYDPLLSSPAGHRALFRLIKAWVVSNPDLAYWQGLDSIAAPLLSLTYPDEALAFSMLNTIVRKYLSKLFLSDNSLYLRHYLGLIRPLLSYHYPLLAVHLHNANVPPDLFAIPWLMTMFAHVLPLERIYPLWDTLLQSPTYPALPHTPVVLLFFAVAVVGSLQTELQSMEFNQMIMYFSSSTGLNNFRADACVSEAIQLLNLTPLPLLQDPSPSSPDPHSFLLVRLPRDNH